MSWLMEHLIRTGYMAESGATRRVRVRNCPAGCKAVVLVGLDGIMCAVEARVDPTPLSELGEALALLEGRHTLALHQEGGRFVVDSRMHLDIAARPAGTVSREDVLRQHRCWTPPATGAQVADTTFVEAAPPPSSDEPPF